MSARPIGQWSQRSVDLSLWSNQTIDLELSTASPTGGGVAFGWSGWGDLRLEHTAPCRQMFPHGREADRRPNLLLVTCDAMRRDHLGCYGATRTVDPQYRSPRPGRPSVRACPGPDRNDIRIILLVAHRRSPDPNRRLFRMGPACRANLPTLPEHLADAGYRTDLGGQRAGARRPAGWFRNAFAETVPVLGNPSQPSQITVRRLLRHLAHRREEPWFVWLHLFEPHPPLMPAQSALREEVQCGSDATRPARSCGAHLQDPCVESCLGFRGTIQLTELRVAYRLEFSSG